MLLIRPMLRANAWRRHKAHVFVFFIFLVSNIGGILTPLGDPPLFLGFLHGVPFFWTVRLWPQALTTVAIVLAAFYAVERVMFAKESAGAHRPAPSETHARHTGRLRIEGGHNLLYLAGILGAVLMSGTWDVGATGIYGVHVEHRNVARDLTILAMGLLSVYTTRRYIREDNGFSWHAIREVGFLFFGIFMTIIPVLMILRAGADGAMGPLIVMVTEPWHYFWMTGALSSFLDNAPTYLTFFNLALGQFGLTEVEAGAILRGLSSSPVASPFALALQAVSCGAVFMGANSYIGNAPNFMVLSIAQENGVKMPSFFGYMAWSVVVLIPSFLLVTWVFFL
jgi:Na+/H+ antiporter NhaD/arsenite permease-like protein